MEVKSASSGMQNKKKSNSFYPLRIFWSQKSTLERDRSTTVDSSMKIFLHSIKKI